MSRAHASAGELQGVGPYRVLGVLRELEDRTVYRARLEADGDGTKLRFSESGFGRITDATVGEKEKGWRFLLETLRAHCEGAEAPQWVD